MSFEFVSPKAEPDLALFFAQIFELFIIKGNRDSVISPNIRSFVCSFIFFCHPIVAGVELSHEACARASCCNASSDRSYFHFKFLLRTTKSREDLSRRLLTVTHQCRAFFEGRVEFFLLFQIFQLASPQLSSAQIC